LAGALTRIASHIGRPAFDFFHLRKPTTTSTTTMTTIQTLVADDVRGAHRELRGGGGWGFGVLAAKLYCPVDVAVGRRDRDTRTKGGR
jgi:hypothetical protein